MAAKGLVIATAVFIAAGGIALGAPLQGGETINITVDDPRPVEKAVQTLLERYGYQITYEDPPYIYRDDLVARSVNGFKDYIPAGGVLSFNFRPSSATLRPSDIAVALERLLEAHAVGEAGGRFRVVRDKDVFHVVPRETRDIRGNWVQQASVLDIPVNLPLKERSGLQALEDICAAASAATGAKIYVGGIPINAIMQSHGDFEATHEPARSVLMRALNRIGRKTVWMLEYDPDTKSYVLGVALVPLKPLQ